MENLIIKDLHNPLNYVQYKNLVTTLAEQNKCTGEQIEEKITDLGAKKVTVEVTFEPAWKASDELRTILGI